MAQLKDFKDKDLITELENRGYSVAEIYYELFTEGRAKSMRLSGDVQEPLTDEVALKRWKANIKKDARLAAKTGN